MGLDISKIKNEALRNYANKVDTEHKQDGNLDEQEFSIFKSTAKDNIVYSAANDEDYKQAFGLQTTNPSAAVTTNPNNQKNEKWVQKKVLRDLNNIEGLTRTNIITELDNVLGDSKNDAAYVNIKKEIQEVLNAMPTTYNSIEEVDNLHKTVKKSLKQAGKKDDFHMDVLEVLENAEKNRIIAEKANEIRGRYNEKMAVAGTNPEAAMDAVKKDLKDAKLYKKEEYEKAYKVVEQERINAAKMNIVKAYQKVSGTDEAPGSTKWRELRKEAKTELKNGNKKLDEYTKKAFKEKTGNIIDGKVSFGKDLAQISANRNNVRVHTTQTEAEAIANLKKSLGDEETAKGLFAKLVEKDLITRTEDNKYDLSKLSTLIHDYTTGSDSTVNRDIKDDKHISERQELLNEITVATGLKDLTQDESIAVAELCGYKVEGKNWGKILKKTLLGGLIGGAAGASTKVKISSTASSSALAELSLKGMTTEQIEAIKSQVASQAGVQVVETGAGVTLIASAKDVAQTLIQPNSALLGAAGFGIGAALAFVCALTEKNAEIPITSTKIHDDTLKDYRVRVQKDNPKYADILTILASGFTDKDGKLNKAAYQEFLEKNAGNDKLNRRELLGALMEYEEPAKVEQPVQKEPEPKPEPVVEPCCDLIHSQNEVDTTFTHRVTYGDSWKGLVEAYYPNWKECFDGKMFGKGGAIQALKKAIAGNDTALYGQLLKGYIPKNINMPAEIGGCELHRDGKVQKITPHGKMIGSLGTVGGRTNSVTHKYKDGCDDTVIESNVALTKAEVEQRKGKKYTQMTEE